MLNSYAIDDQTCISERPIPTNGHATFCLAVRFVLLLHHPFGACACIYDTNILELTDHNLSGKCSEVQLPLMHTLAHC